LARLDTTRPASASQRVAGLGLAAAAAALWALGGLAAQDLFARHHVDPGWLVGVRMASGGLLLLAAFRPAWPRGHSRLLIAVAVLGIAGAQYTWFAAIARSNVALATFVQYSAVAMTAGWQMLRRQVRPTPRRLAAVAAAASGVWLLAAGVPGGLHASRADQAGIAFALVSAVLYSFYLLGSARLVRATGPRAATAWGLSIGSLPFLAWSPPWTAHASGDPAVVAGLVAFMVVAATAIAFSLSQASLRRITPTEFAVTSTLEPALAAVAAAIFLGVTLRPPQYAGGALTILAVLLLALAAPDAPARGRLVRALPGTGGPPVCCDAGMDFGSYARKLWTGRADAYERGFARLTVHAAGPLLDAAGVSIGTRGPDGGTGPGVGAGAAAARGATVTAVDAEPSMIEAAARNVPGLDVRLAVLPDLPLPDGEFDAVTGNFVIHATGDPAAVLAELRRVLRPGGRLALTCWPATPPPALGIAREAIEAAGVPWPQDIPVSPFLPHSSPGAFAALLADAGFAETTAQELSWKHQVDPEEWWDVYRSSVGSNGAVIARQDDATVERIRTEFGRLAAQYATGDGMIALPAVAVLATGIRP
jgi:drug/metabolite transporter (DMT)-like permease/SAM-dependent methyltransferase